MKEIKKELRQINKTLGSTRTFVIAMAQLLKQILDESKRQGQDIREIKSKMEEK